MASKGMLRNTLYAFNCLVVISGLIFIISGAVSTNNAAFQAANMSSIPTGTIIVGVLILLLAFMGYYGAYKENTCMLVSYGTIIIIFAVIQVIVGCVALASKSQLSTLKAGQQYIFDEDLRSYWDIVQQALQCCGVDGPQDYSNKQRPIPASCCPGVIEPGTCAQSEAYQKGCYQVMYEETSKLLNITGGLAIALGLLNFLGGVCACCLTKSVKDNLV